MSAVFGMMSGLPCVSQLRSGGAVCGEPLEMTRVNAISTALTPMVATSAGTRSNATMIPLTTPEPTPIKSASRTHPVVCHAEACGDGNTVTITAASEMAPPTDRSKPRCWMMTCWPIEASARIAMNGNMDKNASAWTLVGARIPPMTNRRIVAIASLNQWGTLALFRGQPPRTCRPWASSSIISTADRMTSGRVLANAPLSVYLLNRALSCSVVSCDEMLASGGSDLSQ